MFRPKKIKKVRVYVLKSKVEEFIQDVHEAGILDMRRTGSREMLEDGRPLSHFDQVSARLLRLRSILTIMEGATGKKAHPGHGRYVAMSDEQLEEQLKKLNDESTALADKIRILENEARVAGRFMEYGNVDFSALNTKTVGLKMGEVIQAKMGEVAANAEKVDNTTFVSKEKSSLAIVLYDRKKQQELEAVLMESGFSDMEVPEGMTTPAETLRRIRAQIESDMKKLREVQGEIADISRFHLASIRKKVKEFEVHADRAEVVSRFGESKCFYVIDGWVLEQDFAKLKALAEKHSPGVLIEEIPFKYGENAPTVLDNPEIAHPLEFITRSYSMPHYFEIDPTMAYFFALPILYGLIVGDVMYGILSFIMGYLLLKKFEDSNIMRNVSLIWMYSAIPSILFGVIYDEYGGMTHYHLLEYMGGWLGMTLVNAPLYEGFHRMENILMLVAITAALGMVHIGFGFVAGAINEWNHNRKHAFAKIAWIGIELGMVLTLLPHLPQLLPELGHPDPILTPIGLAFLVVSTIVIAVVEGIVGIIEIPGLMGNILSYSRIAAIGIVGVVIAELINEAVAPLPEHGLISLLLVPVFLLLHAVNCFIAMFESLIQGGRLNIVEFRSKFLQGGGDAFVPFSVYQKMR